jgi:hypothetical protein
MLTKLKKTVFYYNFFTCIVIIFILTCNCKAKNQTHDINSHKIHQQIQPG